MLGGLQQIFDGGLPGLGSALDLRELENEAARIVKGSQRAAVRKRNRLLEGRRPGQLYTSRKVSCNSRREWRSTKASAADDTSSLARSARRRISRATSSETSSAQRSAVLNATTNGIAKLAL